MDVCSAECDVLRRKSEKGKQKAPRTTYGRTLGAKRVIISAREVVNFAQRSRHSGCPAVSKQMRRFFTPRGGTARHDSLVAPDSDAPSKKDPDYEARVAYRQAKKQGGEKGEEDGDKRKGKHKVKVEGQTSNGFSRRAGIRNRGDYHLATGCPLRGNSRNESEPFARPLSKTPRPPHTSVLMEAPVSVRNDMTSVKTEAKSRVGKKGGRMAMRGGGEIGSKVMVRRRMDSVDAPEFVIAAVAIRRRNVHYGATPGMSPRQSPGL